MNAVAEHVTTLSLEGGCCPDFAGPVHEQMASGKYGLCSVLPLGGTLAEWRFDHRTARKRADRASRLGYRFAAIRRHLYADDIHAINTSLPERQGRPMSAGYHERPSASPDPLYPCERHGVHPYGVLHERTLVAYLWCYRAGELALISQILGHGEHLDDGIMFLLVEGVIRRELAHGGYLVYNRHDSGTEGLRWFKERCGFRETEVEWAL